MWWRKNASKLFSVRSIKGRSGSPGSGKGMGAELAERSFPWEITQKSNAGKSPSQSGEDSGEGEQKWAAASGHTGSSETPARAASLGSGGENTAGLAEKVRCAGCVMLCSQTAQPGLICGFPTAGCLAHPHSCPAFPEIIQRWGGKHYMGGVENLKCLSKAWVDVSLAVQKSWQSHCQV